MIKNLLCLSDFAEFMCRGEHLPGAPAVVVVEVLRDEGTGPDEVVVLVQEEAGPGELPWAGGSNIQIVGGEVLPRATVLPGVDDPLGAGLAPQALVTVAGLLRGDARFTENREVDVVVVAARLLVAGAALQVLVLGPVNDPRGYGALVGGSLVPVLEPRVDQALSNQIIAAAERVDTTLLELGNTAALLTRTAVRYPAACHLAAVGEGRILTAAVTGASGGGSHRGHAEVGGEKAESGVDTFLLLRGSGGQGGEEEELEFHDVVGVQNRSAPCNYSQFIAKSHRAFEFSTQIGTSEIMIINQI